MINSGIDRKFNSGHFDTNMGFQNDAKVRFWNTFKFCVGFSMRRRLRMTYSFRLNIVPSLCFHMHHKSCESDYRGRHSSSVAEVVRNPYGVKSPRIMVASGKNY